MIRRTTSLYDTNCTSYDFYRSSYINLRRKVWVTVYFRCTSRNCAMSASSGRICVALGNSLDKLCHPRSDAYSAEQVTDFCTNFWCLSNLYVILMGPREQNGLLGGDKLKTTK